MDDQSKSQTQLRERHKPELVTIGTRTFISTFRWNDEKIAEYVMSNAETKWLPVGELARVAWGQNTITTKARARKCLSRLFVHILTRHGVLMVIEYAEEGHHRAHAVKMYNPASEVDRQLLNTRLTKLLDKQELSADLYQKALGLLVADAEEA